MGIRENRIEKLLKSEINALGGDCWKWAGLTGVPDQIVIVSGLVWFVEVKTIDGVLSPAQVRRHRQLIFTGAKVRTVYGDEGVCKLIKEITNAIT